MSESCTCEQCLEIDAFTIAVLATQNEATQ